MNIRFCDDLGDEGFGWIVDEPMTRASHALAAEGNVWLIDPVDWEDAIEQARTLGAPAGVVQLLDRHSRDCAALADRLRIPLSVAPDELPGSPFECIPIVRLPRWRESALWWPATRTLVVADALGTNRFSTGGAEPPGVHLLLRLTPPHKLAALGPERLLVGHGEGLIGPGTPAAVRRAIDRSRRDLPRVLVRLPFLARG